jgi:hypothetical protein
MITKYFSVFFLASKCFTTSATSGGASLHPARRCPSVCLSQGSDDDDDNTIQSFFLLPQTASATSATSRAFLISLNLRRWMRMEPLRACLSLRHCLMSRSLVVLWRCLPPRTNSKSVKIFLPGSIVCVHFEKYELACHAQVHACIASWDHDLSGLGIIFHWFCASPRLPT